MKIDKLLYHMKRNGVKLPENGTGRNGTIIAQDLEDALGNYFMRLKYNEMPVARRHCALRRLYRPMKSFRYDKIKPIEQENALMVNSDTWICEEKYNGWRVMVSFVPDYGFRIWGGNISDVDFLPKDYTQHVDCPPLMENAYPDEILLDAEILVHGDVITQDGFPARNTLEATGAVLGASVDVAIQMQKQGARVEIVCFDAITRMDEKNKTPLVVRRLALKMIIARLQRFGLPFTLAESTDCNKERFLNTIWKKGGEGIVLKNVYKPYVSGGRLRDTSIKVKRSMSNDIGDDLDAFITGFIKTDVWSTKKLIGGIVLSVYIEGEQHEIATVTNMPDHIREKLTYVYEEGFELKEEYYSKVLTIDGQELSSRNRKLMHAKVDWDRGYRLDKSAEECILTLEELEAEEF